MSQLAHHCPWNPYSSGGVQDRYCLSSKQWKYSSCILVMGHLCNSVNAALTYWGPLLLLSMLCTLCSANISFILLIMAVDVAPAEGISYTKHIFEYMSTMTMYCPPSKSKRSKATVCHGQSGVDCFFRGRSHCLA